MPIPRVAREDALERRGQSAGLGIHRTRIQESGFPPSNFRTGESMARGELSETALPKRRHPPNCGPYGWAEGPACVSVLKRRHRLKGYLDDWLPTLSFSCRQL